MAQIPIISKPTRLEMNNGSELKINLGADFNLTDPKSIFWLQINLADGKSIAHCTDAGGSNRIISDGKSELLNTPAHPAVRVADAPRNKIEEPKDPQIQMLLEGIIRNFSSEQITEIYAALHKMFDFCRIYRE